MRFFNHIKYLPAIVFGYLSYKTIRLYFIRRKYRNIPGPKSNGIIGFYFGEYFTISQLLSQKIIIHEIQLEWSKKYGSFYVYQFLDKFICISNLQENIKIAMIDEVFPKVEIIYKLLGNPFNERFLGNGLVTEIDKEKWKRRRNLFNHGFKKDILSESIFEFNAKGDLFIQKLCSLCHSKESISIFNEFNRTTLDAIGKIAFDLNIDSINDENSKLNYQLTKGLESCTLMMTDPLSPYKPNKIKLIREIKKSVRDLRLYASKLFGEKINDLEESGQLSNNIISMILKNAKSSDLDYEILIDDFLTFFVAGQETTANALSFCIYELGQNKNVLKKLVDEVSSVLGKKSEITNDDLSKLIYTEAVFKESMRKWPPVAGLYRNIPEGKELCGYALPKNTWFVASPFLLARNPIYFPQPEKFIPERFIQNHTFSKENTINAYTYIPFSVGPRNCIGQNFAKIEGKLILAKFIQYFDFKLDPNQSFKIAELTTIRPIDGVKVFLSPRF